jgi:hypothetical protein
MQRTRQINFGVNCRSGIIRFVPCRLWVCVRGKNRGTEKGRPPAIYVSKTEERGGSLFGRLFSRKTLVFRYDPAMNSPLPLITASGPNTVLISISRISSIMFQSKSWDNVTIDYVIGQVDYPRTDASGQKP